MEGNSRAKDAATKNTTVEVYIPADETIPGETVIEDNVPVSQVIADNNTKVNGNETDAQMNRATKSMIVGDTEQVDTWKHVEVPASALDIKSVPKASVDTNAIKLAPKE